MYKAEILRFNHYLFFSIDKRFRFLPTETQKKYRSELATIFEQDNECRICAYATSELKGLFKFMLLVRGLKQSSVQRIVRKLFNISMGKYLELSYVPIGFAQVSQYISKQVCNVIRDG